MCLELLGNCHLLLYYFSKVPAVHNAAINLCAFPKYIFYREIFHKQYKYSLSA